MPSSPASCLPPCWSFCLGSLFLLQTAQHSRSSFLGLDLLSALVDPPCLGCCFLGFSGLRYRVAVAGEEGGWAECYLVHTLKHSPGRETTGDKQAALGTTSKVNIPCFRGSQCYSVV
ncbi:hypothetical protein HDK64DRAFT_262644 [Phyllosticta capitalensis]